MIGCAARPASAATAGDDGIVAGASATSAQTGPTGLGGNAALPQSDQVQGLTDERLGGQLMWTAEALGSPEAPVPAFQKHASDLYPLIASSGHLYSSSALLARAIEQNRALGLHLLLAAARKGNSARFRALIDAGADVNGWYAPDGTPGPGFEEWWFGHRGKSALLLQLAVMMGPASIIPVIVAVPELDLKRSVRLVAESIFAWRYLQQYIYPTADQLACVAALISQPRVAADLLTLGCSSVSVLAVAVGDVGVLSRLRSSPVTSNDGYGRHIWSNVRQAAEEHGQILVLEWLHEECRRGDLPPMVMRQTDVGAASASLGQIGALDWLAAHGYLGSAARHLSNEDADARYADASRSGRLWKAAGRSGNMAFVNYLRGHFETGNNWDPHVLEEAVACGQAMLVQRLIAAGCPFRQGTLMLAIRHRRIEALTHMLDHADGAEVDLTDATLCAVAAIHWNLAALKLLRERGVPWTSDVITKAINADEESKQLPNPEYKQFLQWALDNGAPLESTSDESDSDDVDSYGEVPRSALEYACRRDCYVAMLLLADCYSQRRLQLDLNGVADALLAKNCFLGRRWSVTSARSLQWLHGEKGFRFTIEHMRTAVLAHSFLIILKLRELGCPWDASVIPTLVVEASNNDTDMGRFMQLLIMHGCPMDITTCEAVNANPHIGWARDVLNGLECPCGHELHQHPDAAEADRQQR